MGFYGNITNTNKTQFTFDRTYPNRHSMDLNAQKDGVYLGRYVLVEYDLNAIETLENGDNYLRVFCSKYTDNIDIKDLDFYSEKNEDIQNIIKYTDVKATDVKVDGNEFHGADNGVLMGQIVYLMVDDDLAVQNNKKEYKIFLQCSGSKKKKINNEDVDIAVFTRVKSINGSNYVDNFNIDEKIYGPSRGFDSTVWQKVYTNDTEKYVMIAELNSVVPTFDISIDAPTMIPLTPHFDTDSTSVYYNLHWQPQWGLRVADADGNPSDSQTYWTREEYDKATGVGVRQYYNKESNAWQVVKEGAEIPQFDAAIYFNRDAFDPQVNKKDGEIKKHATGDNYFNILPTGQSGQFYNAHDGKGTQKPAADIQEMRVNLPAIGNMMSDAWDIIHGPNRDDSMKEFEYITLEDGTKKKIRIDSLQGRLDSIANLNTNEIPIKRSTDGKLVGTQINGGNNRIEEEITEILDEALSTSLTEDDAWIYTKIDPNAITEDHNSGIAIHHTFHKTTSTTSSVNKNDGTTTQSETDEKKKDNLATENLTAEKDKLNLYVPYVDKAGHVVGHNIETVTLPYSYRHYETNGVSSEDTKDIYTTVTNVDGGNNSSEAATDTKTNIAASETQDTLTVNPGNKWIQAKFEVVEDELKNINKLTIAHEIHAVNTVAKTSNINDNGDKITVQDIEFDAAGHVTKNQKHTYTLPYGYKEYSTEGISSEEDVDIYTTVTLDNEKGNHTDKVEVPGDLENITIANNTQDAMVINPANKWIQIKFDTDTLNIAHEIHAIPTISNGTTNSNKEDNIKDENNLNIPDWEYDKAGHITGKHDHYYTLPFGFKTITTNGIGEGIAVNATDDLVTTKVIADSTQDSLAINSGNKWIRIDTDIDKDSLTISHDIHEIKTDLVEDTNLNNSVDTGTDPNKLDIPDWTYDEAGHITSKKSHSYILPYGFKTIATDKGSIVADFSQDTATINGDSWIKITTTDTDNENNPNTNKIEIKHQSAIIPNGFKEGDANGAPKTPKFGETFIIEDHHFDTNGHKYATGSHTVTIPGLSLTPGAEKSNVVTGISLDQSGQTFIETKAYIGSLKLDGYEKLTAIAAGISSKDSLNTGLGKLEYKIEEEVKDRGLAIADAISTASADAATKANNAESNAKTYAKGLIEGLDYTDTAITGQYVSAVKEVDGVIEVTRAALPTLTTGNTNGTVAFNGADVKVAGLKSAAYTESSAYATAAQGNKADSALQPDDPITVGEGEEAKSKTVKELLEIIFKLQDRITALENQLNPQEPDNTEPTT